jgi:hypothetical protein
VVVVTLDVMVMVMAAALHVTHDPAVVLVVRSAWRVVVREGGRDRGGKKGRGSRGDQKTVHSLVPHWLDVA